MKKIIFLLFIGVVLFSCQKQYQCACTDLASQEVVLTDKYKATSLQKKNAIRACKTHNNIIDTTLVDCHIQ